MSINILARRAYDASATWAVLRNSVDFVEARKHVLGKYWDQLDQQMALLTQSANEVVKEEQRDRPSGV